MPQIAKRRSSEGIDSLGKPLWGLVPTSTHTANKTDQHRPVGPLPARRTRLRHPRSPPYATDEIHSSALQR